MEIGRKRGAPVKDQPGLTTLKPSVVLTRLIDFDSKASTPQGSPLPSEVKSEAGSRKNSVDEDPIPTNVVNLVGTAEGTNTPVSQLIMLTTTPASTSTLPKSTKSPLKRKIGPASKVGGN